MNKVLVQIQTSAKRRSKCLFSSRFSFRGTNIRETIVSSRPYPPQDCFTKPILFNRRSYPFPVRSSRVFQLNIKKRVGIGRGCPMVGADVVGRGGTTHTPPPSEREREVTWATELTHRLATADVR